MSRNLILVKVTIPEGYDLEYIASRGCHPLVGLTAEDLLNGMEKS